MSAQISPAPATVAPKARPGLGCEVSGWGQGRPDTPAGCSAGRKPPAHHLVTAPVCRAHHGLAVSGEALAASFLGQPAGVAVEKCAEQQLRGDAENLGNKGLFRDCSSLHCLGFWKTQRKQLGSAIGIPEAWTFETPPPGCSGGSAQGPRSATAVAIAKPDESASPTSATNQSQGPASHW